MGFRQITLHHQTQNKLERLKREAELDGESRVAKRIHAVLLNANDYTSGEIAGIVGASLSRVSEWLRRYEGKGYRALLEGHRSGRPSGLSEDQLLQLSDILDSGPVAHGYLSGVWTSPMVTRVIADEFNRKYHPGHVRKMLAGLGFSIQRPKALLARADKEKQDQWHRYTYPDVKKKRKTTGASSSSKTKRVSAKTPRSTKRGRASAISR